MVVAVLGLPLFGRPVLVLVLAVFGRVVPLPVSPWLVGYDVDAEVYDVDGRPLPADLPLALVERMSPNANVISTKAFGCAEDITSTNKVEAAARLAWNFAEFLPFWARRRGRIPCQYGINHQIFSSLSTYQFPVKRDRLHKYRCIDGK